VFFVWKAIGKFEFIIKNGKRIFLSREFLYDIMKYNRKEKVMKELSKISIPCLLLHGENDPWVTLENVTEISAKICSSVKHVLILKGVDHMPLDRVGSEQIIANVLPWLENVCGGILQGIPPIISFT
jgi:pimeloyl-ACP methyl ester carboxylesterase